MKRLALSGAILATALLSVGPPSRAQDSPPAPAVALQGDEEAGREVFAAECRVCHAGAIAPNLRGVSGRKIASAADFPGYSPALKAKGDDSWTDANLEAFLTNPAAFAPGTLMVKTLPEGQVRADVIAYLKSLPAPKAEP